MEFPHSLQVQYLAAGEMPLGGRPSPGSPPLADAIFHLGQKFNSSAFPCPVKPLEIRLSNSGPLSLQSQGNRDPILAVIEEATEKTNLLQAGP